VYEVRKNGVTLEKETSLPWDLRRRLALRVSQKFRQPRPGQPDPGNEQERTQDHDKDKAQQGRNQQSELTLPGEFRDFLNRGLDRA